MSDGLIIDVDTAALIAALNAFPDACAKHCKIAAKETADSIAREARTRVARRTGATAAGITVEEARSGDGYVVLPFDYAHTTALIHSGNTTQPNLPTWLEFGTKYMRARPYFFASVEIERGPHDRRIAEAIQNAITEQGLGDA